MYLKGGLKLVSLVKIEFAARECGIWHRPDV